MFSCILQINSKGNSERWVLELFYKIRYSDFLTEVSYKWVISATFMGQMMVF